MRKVQYVVLGDPDSAMSVADAIWKPVLWIGILLVGAVLYGVIYETWDSLRNAPKPTETGKQVANPAAK